MFLSILLESGEAGRSRRGTVLGKELTVPVESLACESANYGVPFRADGGRLYFGDAAIPERVT